MQSATDCRDEVQLGFQADGDAGEDVAAERVVPRGIGVGVVRSITGRGVADDERRLAVQHVVDSQPQFEPLPDPEDGGEVEIVLRSQSCVSRTDLVRQVELGIERGELHPAQVAPLERQRNSMQCVPGSPSRVFPTRLHAAGGAEQARTIVRRRKSPIVHDPAQNVGAAKTEACRA